MKKILLSILICFSLSGCGTILNDLNATTDTKLPVSIKTRTTVKDYKILGVVQGQYSRTCVLFGLVCFGDVFIYDDLMRKTEQLDGDHVLNMVIDTETSSPLWYVVYSHARYKANGLAVKLGKTYTQARFSYGEE